MKVIKPGWAVRLKDQPGLNYQRHIDGSLAFCFETRDAAKRFARERAKPPGNYVVRKCTVTIEVQEKGGKS